MSDLRKALNPNNASGPLRVVSIGGGTGLSTLLHGLKQYVRGHGVRLYDADGREAA